MTDEKYGITGEYWKFISNTYKGSRFIESNVYRSIKPLDYNFSFLDEKKSS